MEEVLYTFLLCFILSIWIISYAYIRAEQEITAHENKTKAFKKELHQKMKNLNERKKQLEEKIAQLQNELEELRAENNSEESQASDSPPSE